MTSMPFDDLKTLGHSTIYKKEQFLFYRGDIGNDFYIIEDGIVELSIFDLEGDKRILSELGSNDFFGHVEIFTNGIRLTNALAKPGTTLIGLTATTVLDYLSSNSDKAISLIKNLCIAIDHNVEIIEDSLNLTAFQKVSKKIFELGCKNKSQHVFINQRQISEFLSISEKTTNTSLRRLKELGAIEVKRSRIEILNADLLKNQFEIREGMVA